MSAKKKKRDRKRDFVSMRYRITALPPGVSRRQFYETAIEAAQSGSGELPEGWNVDWIWRNDPKQDEREEEFSGAIKHSRSGFLVLMARRLRRDLSKLGVEGPPDFEAPEASAAQLEQIEQIEQEAEEERETKPKRKRRRSVPPTKRRKRKTRARERVARSKAARKGWRTRRAKAEKRRASARKAARTRKRNKRR